MSLKALRSSVLRPRLAKEKPIYASCSGQKKHTEAAKAFLEPRGIPTFWFAEEALEALSLAAQCREAMERKGRQEDEG